MCKDPRVKVNEVFTQRTKLGRRRGGWGFGWRTQREVAREAQATKDLEYHVLVKSLNFSLLRKWTTESLGTGKLQDQTWVLGR